MLLHRTPRRTVHASFRPHGHFLRLWDPVFMALDLFNALQCVEHPTTTTAAAATTTNHNNSNNNTNTNIINDSVNNTNNANDIGTTQTHPTPTTPCLIDMRYCVNQTKGHI